MNTDYEHITLVKKAYLNLEITDKSFKRCDIRNTKIGKSFFVNCDFARSSLVNLRISECTFENCKFYNADILMCKFSKCSFINCDFSLADTSNNNFYKCSLNSTKFIASRVANNSFNDTQFFNVDLNGSSTKFNSFQDCVWNKSIFGNCTIDYNITHNCKFINSYLNIETLGSVWGIEEKNLENITFVFLGQIIKEMTDDIYSNIRENFLKEGTHLEAFVFDVSFLHKNIISCTEVLIQQLKNKYNQDDYLTPEELQFLYDILATLHKKEMLPLLIINDLLFFAQETLLNKNFDESYKDVLILFCNNLYLLYSSMMNELSTYSLPSDDDNHTFVVKMVFYQKPNRDIADTINDTYKFIYGKSPVILAKRIKEHQGSYIVYVLMTLGGFAAFNIATYLLTGGIKKLVKLRAAFSVLFSKKLPRKYYLDVYKDDDTITISKDILKLLVPYNSLLISDSLKNLTSDGINSDNLKEIIEVEPSLTSKEE